MISLRLQGGVRVGLIIGALGVLCSHNIILYYRAQLDFSRENVQSLRRGGICLQKGKLAGTVRLYELRQESLQNTKVEVNSSVIRNASDIHSLYSFRMRIFQNTEVDVARSFIRKSTGNVQKYEN